MKKAIALFSVFALALALTPVLAGEGNYAAGTDVDDSVFTQVRNRVRTINFTYEAEAEIESETDININTGQNALLAGDDLDAGSIDSGDLDVEFVENSDVNGFDIVLDCACDNSGSGDNTQEWEDADDTVVTQVDNAEEEVNVEAELELEEENEFDLNLNTGQNVAAGGGDVGEDSPITVKSGRADVKMSRTNVRNVSSFAF